MDYEKLYKDALERASKICNSDFEPNDKLILCSIIFPELKLESEDEKIRKVLLNDFKNHCSEYYCEGINRDMIIAWLEKQKEPEDKGEISDGYHTFNELYRYRMLYNAAFFNLLPKHMVHKSKRHHDGEECFGGGWFIVMANLPTGQISNHYELKDWDLFQVPEKYTADEWDVHTPQEAADRLHKYLLEKQGEQSSLPKWKYKKDDIPLLRDSLILNKYGCVLKAPSGAIISNAWVLDYAELAELPREEPEKQDEQKTVDKVKPKFKVGDWITHNKANFVFKIINIGSDGYEVVNRENYKKTISFDNEDTYHLWTIQDAKDGDVLCYHCSATAFFLIGIFKRVAHKDELWGGTYRNHAQYGGYGSIENYTLQVAIGNDELHHCGSIVCPSTKEQRDLLFRKMKEAGYVWDADKKEPKKIVSKTLDTNQIKKQDEQKFTDVGQKFHKGDYEDGIYLCYEDGYKKPFPTPFPLAADTTNHGLLTHIGIKVGERKVGLKLNSLGEHELPYDRGLGSDDFGYKKQEIYALYDYDGEANTDHLEQHGEFEFDLDDDEWIPALGELAIIYKNRDKLNEALAFVGGDELVEDWHWSSTEYSAISAWYVNFCNGSVSNTHKSDGPVIRPVCAF